MNKKYLIPISLIILTVVGVLAFYIMQKNRQPEKITKVDVTGTPGMRAVAGVDETNLESDASKVMTVVTANNFAFEPKEIKVKKGDTVTIQMDNIEGFHDIVIDEFNVHTKQVQGPGKDSITFIAGTAGTFEYYCSVGKHRQMGMVGKLVVEE